MGPGWFSIAFDVHGGTVDASGVALNLTPPVVSYVALYDEKGEWIGSTHFVTYDAYAGATVEVTAPGSEPLRWREEISPPTTAPASFPFNYATHGIGGLYGRYYALGFAAGGVDGHGIRVRGTEDVRVFPASLLSGPEAFFADTRDFTAPLLVDSFALTAGARVTADGTFEIEAHANLVTTFRRTDFVAPSGAGPFALHFPNGTIADCPCHFPGFDGPERRGSFQYRMTEAGVSVGPLGHPVVSGADARLPMDFVE